MRTLLPDYPVRLAERRLTRRVERAWREIAKDRLPSWETARALDLGDDWASCFAVDLRLSDGFPYFIYVGDELCRFSNIYLSGSRHCEETLLDLATEKMDEAALSRAPVFFDNALRLFDRRRVVFRSALMPLSEDGANVTHLLGAANGKFAPRRHD
ncbi:MAG: PAS domain-containing protein [Hyphococcus sp.]